MTTHNDNQPRRTLLLTGASRGIGHATVKRFSAAGWRVITCSRHAFPENCPWEAGPEDHIQVDLADPHGTRAAIDEQPDPGPFDAQGFRGDLTHPAEHFGQWKIGLVGKPSQLLSSSFDGRQSPADRQVYIGQPKPSTDDVSGGIQSDTVV